MVVRGKDGDMSVVFRIAKSGATVEVVVEIDGPLQRAKAELVLSYAALLDSLDAVQKDAAISTEQHGKA